MQRQSPSAEIAEETMRVVACIWFASLALTAAQEKPVEVARLPSYTESPAIDHDGNVFVSEPFGKNVSRISPDGPVTVWASTGNPNGHKVLADGTHLVCDREQHAVMHLSPDGKILRRAATMCEGRSVQEPNDLTLDREGGFYFTDPGFEGRERAVGFICHVDAEGRTRIVDDDLKFPNGIVLRPDGRELVVSFGAGKDQILEYHLLDPGVVGEVSVFAERGSDGMALDTDGNLYTTYGGPECGYVAVLDETGRYSVPMAFVSNIVFGGPDLNQIWVTGRFHPFDFDKPLVPQMLPSTGNYGLVYRLDLEGVRGLPTLPPKQ